MICSTLKKLTLASLMCFYGNGFASSNSRISDTPITPSYEGYERTAPLLEFGNAFLDTGNIDPGFEIPTGAVWQPHFMIFGDMRTAVQDYDNAGRRSTEWANRLNLFGQLKLTGTERFLIGFRPLDSDGRFSGKTFEPENETINEFNADIETFYFEGEFGELFPELDPTDTKKLDWGFAVGRQPLLIQEGLLINDIVDAIGIVRNSITLPGVPNMRVTGLFGWDEINRNDNQEDKDAKLYGLFTEMDIKLGHVHSTVDIDMAYIESKDGGDGYYIGLSGVQRVGHLNTSFRALYSKAIDEESALVSTGTLLFAETSFSPAGTYDNVYVNGFVGIDQYSSASRDRGTGGPLGRTGILYSAVGLGQYGSALSNDGQDAYGIGVGYQKFMDGGRRQLIVEIGGRQSSEESDDSAVAIGARFQQAFGKRTILVLDGFLSDSDSTGGGSGIRSELRWKF